MITLDEAFDIVIRQAKILPAETVDLVGAPGRRLAVPVVSDINMPPFRKAAVDGFACRKTDLNRPLTLAGIIAAGKSSTSPLPPASCFKIMTGAPVPDECDTVFMVEQSRVTNDGQVIFTGEGTKTNICEKGEDFGTGETVIDKQTLIKPQHIAILAAVGYTKVPVYKRPVVSVIVTGDELVEPDRQPEGAFIRNSNGWQLIAQITKAGGTARYRGIIADRQEKLKQTIAEASAVSEIIILSGGISKGDYDYVPDALQQLGATISFREIAVQPGKPTLFARLNDTMIFGLPGNPVSTLLQFHFLVAPLIDFITGGNAVDTKELIPMGVTHTRKKAGRQSFFPVRISHGEVFPVPYNGSADIRSFAVADGVVSFGKDQVVLGKGEQVEVFIL